MNPQKPTLLLRAALLSAATAAALFSHPAFAGEAEIRKTLAERYGDKLPAVDEVRQSPIPSIWEVRLGNEIIYTDDTGSHIIQGQIVSTGDKRNITAERVDKLISFQWNDLPLKDAITWTNGKGKRHIAVFADPNCGYCKKLERDLVNLPNVTVHTFLIAILGGDSPDKARQILCAKNPTKAWRDWMVDSVPPPALATDVTCDSSAIARNAALAAKHRVTGTPAIVFSDGSRAPGAIPASEIDKRLTDLDTGTKTTPLAAKP